MTTGFFKTADQPEDRWTRVVGTVKVANPQTGADYQLVAAEDAQTVISVPADAIEFTAQPTIGTPWATGPILLTYGEGPGVVSVEALTFNGVDIRDRIRDGNSTPPVPPQVGVGDLFVYGQTNTLTLRTRLTGSNGFALSDTIAATVLNVPGVMTAPSAVGGSGSVTFTRASDPQSGGSAITSYDLEWTTNISASPVNWTRVTGIGASATVSGFPTATQVWGRTRAVNALGGGVFSAPGAATTTGVAGINPITEGLQFVPGGGGVADNLRVLGFAYSGSDTLDFYGVTSTSATPPSRADIKAGTGTGTLQAFSRQGVSLSTIDVLMTGLTAASNAATFIHGFVEERNNGGFFVPRTVAVSGLDFTAPTIVSAATNTEGTQTTLITSEPIFGTGVVGNWTLNNGGSVAISAVTVGADRVTLTHAAVANGQTITYSYSGGNIRDAKANSLANISSASVTNNVPATFTNIFTPAVGRIIVEQLAVLAPLTFTPGVGRITVEGDTVPRSVFYRVKDPVGAFVRQTGTPPFDIITDVEIQLDNEDGTLVDRAPIPDGYTDEFTGTDGASLTGFTARLGAVTATIQSNRARLAAISGTTVSQAYNTLEPNGVTAQADGVFAETTLGPNNGDADHLIGFRDPVSGRSYVARVRIGQGQINIFRLSNTGVETLLTLGLQFTPGNVNLVSGDVIRLQRVVTGGNAVLTAFRNGSQATTNGTTLASSTDSSADRITGSVVPIFGHRTGAATPDSTRRCDHDRIEFGIL